MNNTEKKNEVLEKSNVKKEQDLTSSYVKISELTVNDIKSFSTATAVFVPKVTKLSKSFTYEVTLNSKGLIINSLGDSQKYRENISLDEFNMVRLSLGKLDPYFLNHQFEGVVYYRLVKGYKQDNSRYYSMQYWLSPLGRCHTHFFSETEVKLMKVLIQVYGEKFSFIEKPVDIVENEKENNVTDLETDIL